MHIRLTHGKLKSTATAIRTIYDKEKGRGVQIMLGNFSPYAARITDVDLPFATEDEFNQAVAWLAEKRAERELAQKSYATSSLIRTATDLTRAIEEGDPSVWEASSPDALQTVLEALIGAMRKAKLWAPTRRAGKPQEHASNEGFTHDPDQVILPGFLENVREGS